MSENQNLQQEEEPQQEIKLNENEQFIQNQEEFRGWHLPSESYRIGKKSWKVNKECKKPALNDKISDFSQKLDEIKISVKSGEKDPTEALKESRAIHKQILEMTLLGFNYDQEVEEYGHKTLAGASSVMQGLFLAFGSWEEMIYSIKQQMDAVKLQLKQEEGILNG